MNVRKEKENRKLLAQKIESGRDEVAEFLFEETGQKIIHDPIIQSDFHRGSKVAEQAISKRLLQFYFTGYWSKFNISIACFNRELIKNCSVISSLYFLSSTVKFAFKIII